MIKAQEDDKPYQDPVRLKSSRLRGQRRLSRPAGLIWPKLKTGLGRGGRKYFQPIGMGLRRLLGLCRQLVCFRVW